MGVNFLGPVLVILVAAVFLYVLFFLISRHFRTIIDAWTSVSKQLNLNLNLPSSKWMLFMGHYPSLSGRYKDLHFDAHMYHQGSGKSKVIYTSYKFTLQKNQSGSFRLYKEGFFSKIGKLIGVQDVQLGHEDFDSGYMIKSDNELFVKQLLNLRIRQLILRKMPAMKGEFVINGNFLEYREPLMINNEKKRKEWLNSIEVGYELAKAIDDI
jgi:hypothetical protein